ncbi:hypothetical protein LZK73_18665 [Neorhizobium galegae]|nr:hypothetical protein LZK73_18665 [Neorhizobium galegae]
MGLIGVGLGADVGRFLLEGFDVDTGHAGQQRGHALQRLGHLRVFGTGERLRVGHEIAANSLRQVHYAERELDSFVGLVLVLPRRVAGFENKADDREPLLHENTVALFRQAAHNDRAAAVAIKALLVELCGRDEPATIDTHPEGWIVGLRHRYPSLRGASPCLRGNRYRSH